MPSLAPPTAMGRTQIIPSCGPHTQVYCSELTAKTLVMLGLIDYDPDYGPNARVYRPVHRVSGETVQGWVG